jgi:hypothetical protein
MNEHGLGGRPIADQPHAFELAPLPPNTVRLSELTDIVPPPRQIAQHQERSAVPQAASKPAPTIQQEPTSARAIVAALRKRLRVVEREIKIRKALEQERGQIKRLIEAAQSEQGKVHRLRPAM